MIRPTLPRFLPRFRLNLPLLDTVASGLAIVLAAVLFLFVLVSWLWRLVAPMPFAVVASGPADPVSTLRITALFGKAPKNSAPQTATVVAPADLNLLGLIAHSGGQGGYAVFRNGSGSTGNVLIAQVGDAVNSQQTLVRIDTNSVTLRDQSGNERQLILRQEAAASPAAPTSKSATTRETTASRTSRARNTQAQAQAHRNSCVPEGYKGFVVQLNIELLAGALRQPETFYALLDRRDDGLSVKQDNGFAAMLGLRGGDLIQSANGVALRQVEDISTAILAPLSSGQNVQLQVSRSGRTTEVLLVNASGCG